MNQRPHCLIAGAGIGGLTCAIALAQRGISVELVEQSPQLEEIGAGIQLSPNAMQVFAHLGLNHDLSESAFEPKNIALRDFRDSRALLHVPIKQFARSRYGQPYLHIHRADLIGVLRTHALQSGVQIHLGEKVVGYRQNDKQVTLLGDRNEYLGDVLIGADGINSNIRSTLLGPQNARFTGQVAWRGIIPSSAVDPNLIPPDANSWLGPGAHFVSYYLRQGQLINFVAVQERSEWSQESWHVEGDVQQLRAAFANWNSSVTQLLEKCEKSYLWGLFDRKPQTVWSKGRVTLLGDACHAMLPFVAQGAAMAIEDAFVLARCIAQHKNLASALKDYETARKPRTARIQTLSRRNATTFHLRGTLQCFIRNRKFALANRSLALTHSQLDPIFKPNVTT